MIKFNPPENKRNYSITIFVDSKQSWFFPWAEKLKKILDSFHNVHLCSAKENIKTGDFNFILGCTKILEQEYLLKNKLNLVVHESDLPLGRGWSPVSWQILQGKNEIPVVLFEVSDELDSGPIYLKDAIVLQGNELLPEIKAKQGRKTIEMILKFLEKWPDIIPKLQKGEPSYFDRRGTEDDMLDVNKTIAENFNHLRIIDNKKYPAWFQYKEKKYIIKIFPCEK